MENMHTDVKVYRIHVKKEELTPHLLSNGRVLLLIYSIIYEKKNDLVFKSPENN